MFGQSLPRDREQRWAVLDAVIGAWFPAWSGKRGVDASDMIEAERRLGFALPVAFREFYERYAGCLHVWSRQDRLLMPGEWWMERGVLTFCDENQSVVQWSIRVDGPAVDDPPVLVSDPSGSTASWVEGDSMSAFAVQFAVQNVKWSASLTASANGNATPRAIELLERRYERLPFPDMHWPAHPTRFFGNSDLIVETHGAEWIWVSARSREAFDELDALLHETGMMWEWSSLDS